jgi:cytochrome P450
MMIDDATEPLERDDVAGLVRFPREQAAAMVAGFDLRALPARFYANPFPYYHALRDIDPVFELPDGSYFLTRYDDVNAVYRDPAGFSSDKRAEFAPKFGVSPLYEHHTTSLVFNDPPLHGRVRRIIAGALTPRAIAGMEPALVGLVDRLLDVIAAKGRVDLIEDFAAAIPVEVIGNLLGVPHEERGPLRGWSLAILSALEPAIDPTVFDEGNRAVRGFIAYLQDLVARRRRQPGDPDTDVLTRLIQGEPDGERLSEPELLHNCIFILNAGHETTTNLIGNGLQALADWPDQRQRLIADPSLVTSAVEEILRFESSNQLGNRRATQAIEIGGRLLPAGSLITLGIGAANRDPAQFPAPDDFDVGRAPNRHLAFGAGRHHCVGMSLARLEGKIAIARFLARFPDYRLAAPPVRGGRARFRGFQSLPVAV